MKAKILIEIAKILNASPQPHHFQPPGRTGLYTTANAKKKTCDACDRPQNDALHLRIQES